MSVVAAVLALMLVCAGPAAGQLTGSDLQVESLEFEGNQSFPDDSLRLAIVNRETGCRLILLPLCKLGFGFAQDEEYLYPRELPGDVVRLQIYYYERGFRETRVASDVVEEPDSAHAHVTFRITEGQPILIDSLTFFGVDEAESGALLAGLPVARGDPLSTIVLDQVRDTLLTRLRNEGYVNADVLRSHFIPQNNPHAAQVTYDIDPGPRARVGSLDFRVVGESPLSESVVRRMLPFEEGSLYSELEVQQAQRNLYGLDIVRNALIAVDTLAMRSAPDTLVPLRIDVGTNSRHRVRFGTGWSMSECLAAEALWASRNVFGGAQRLQVTGRLSNIAAERFHDAACQFAGVDEFGGINWTVSTELNLPWVLSPRNSFSGSLFWERQSLPDVFIRESVGLNLGLTRTIALRTPLTLFYRPQRSSLEAADIFFCTSLLVCNPEDFGILEEPNWLSPVGLGISRDRIDNVLNPASGYSAHFEGELADALSGSDFSYARVTGDGAVYKQLARRTVWAVRLRSGWAGAADFGAIEGAEAQIIHPQKRFFAGGASSVRGFGQNRLGPSVLTVEPSQLIGPATVEGTDTVPQGPCTPEEIVDFTCDANALDDDAFTQRPTGGNRLFEGSFEYRFRIGESFQGVSFLDFGQVWDEQTPVRLGSLEWTPGIGVRFFSPIGPLRLDLAYRLSGGEDLAVVTSRIRPFVPGQDNVCPPPSSPNCNDDRIGLPVVNANGEVIEGAFYGIPWVQEEELALLVPAVLYGAGRSFWSRLQIHFSIGQAF